MTGTGKEVAKELGDVYGLSVVRIPTNRPLERSGDLIRVYPRAETKWEAIVERIRQLHHQGRPVLVGTRSVETSEHLSYLLKIANLEHKVLNARQDQEEAQIIADAGMPGNITVATNMAGRGTDIKLGDGVPQLGGLHVIATELHDSRRIDRQLFGRCGRQGDPGSYEIMVSVEDELISTYAKRLGDITLSRYRFSKRPLPPALGNFLFRCAQMGADRRHRHLRRELLRMDIQMEKTLAFSGVAE
jgi:preprotein translocase subunit SecA